MLLWAKYYGKKMFEKERIEHKAGEKFAIEVSRVALICEGDDCDKMVENSEWLDSEGERVRRLLMTKGDLLWSEVLGEDFDESLMDGSDIVLKVVFVVDGDEYEIWYSWGDRWDYPVSFPPYTDDELEEEWGKRGREYRHSFLSVEVSRSGGDMGQDITDKLNRMLGPLGNMFKGRTCAYKASWFCEEGDGEGDGELNVIDNDGNDFQFKGSERVVFGSDDE